MEEDEDMLPPFWLQSDGDRGRRRRLHRSYSLMISSGAFLICIIVMACVIVFIVLPTLRSFTSHIFRPQLVKKSWDSLNLVLVLFAIVCGFLGRNSNETPRSSDDRRFSEAASDQEFGKSNPETPTRRWYEYSESDRTVINRMRSFSSYPDLRQESMWVSGDERWRFHDDTRVGSYSGSDLDDHRQLRYRRIRSEVIEEEHDAVKNIAVDTFVVRAKEVPSATPIPETRQPPPSPHPLPPSPPQVQHTEGVRRNAKRSYYAPGRLEKDELEVRKSQPPHLTTAPSSSSPAQPANGVPKNSRRTYRSSRPAPMIEKEEIVELEVRNFPPPPSIPPPPPPPPPLPLFYQSSEKKTGQGKKKRVSATKEFLTSLRGKKKKQRQRSIENFESFLNSQASHPPPSTPPPPPPPPPPPSVFYNLFSPRKPKHKKVHSVPPPPSAPPPPVLPTRVSKTQKTPITNEREIFNSMEGNILTGNESPFHRIPPPPPPPPFGIPAWKFRVQGDFIRINSVRSSRSNSPDIDDDGVDSPTIQEQPATPPLFCHSPDVDTKADTFIARFRAGLKLEKMNSMKGKSNLGPS
ncbi:hypothetical protein QN277_022329 [Acacia crassicarpa]|uniref:Hydroxyproline-rich glycoprotein family protein n=1 Tax=Acacia crassicarpa TaxID=499986 RepID=A0AAE1KBF9_9FABA|nr:hypothetical protein QN277_022329 [Acacia crassicarpa]